MRFRRGTCGVCKPTKRYKTNATRKSQKIKGEILDELSSNTSPAIGFREINK